MKIAIDLEGTLIAECGEFACERPHLLARLLLPCGLRVGARTLLRDLSRAGHNLTLYTSNRHNKTKLKLWCLLNGLPFRQILTIHQCTKQVPGKEPEVIWPPAQSHDLVLDDSPVNVDASQRQGVHGLHITNYDSDWTTLIKKACL